ncbi:hypothetical protein AOQ84DRAFT_228058 [Glonium stellatum]|uniref:Uncharacterized protein n=1 Tax=Glonium stellatum TaxID=574774 RepID=A0A8E2JMQ1_9PEZI|nr:hypothetical protein AOQ84DRAFT_228058 [Glonium stellatum]
MVERDGGCKGRKVVEGGQSRGGCSVVERLNIGASDGGRRKGPLQLARCWVLGDTNNNKRSGQSMRGLERCGDHEKAHEKGGAFADERHASQPVEVPATCFALHSIFFLSRPPPVSSRHQHTGIGLPAARAYCVQSEPSGAADWTGSLHLSALPPAAQTGHGSQRESHHHVPSRRRLGVDNRGGWATSTRITAHLLFIFISLSSSARRTSGAGWAHSGAGCSSTGPCRRRHAALHASARRRASLEHCLSSPPSSSCMPGGVGVSRKKQQEEAAGSSKRQMEWEGGWVGRAPESFAKVSGTTLKPLG